MRVVLCINIKRFKLSGIMTKIIPSILRVGDVGGFVCHLYDCYLVKVLKRSSRNVIAITQSNYDTIKCVRTCFLYVLYEIK